MFGGVAGGIIDLLPHVVHDGVHRGAESLKGRKVHMREQSAKLLQEIHRLALPLLERQRLVHRVAAVFHENAEALSRSRAQFSSSQRSRKYDTCLASP